MRSDLLRLDRIPLTLAAGLLLGAKNRIKLLPSLWFYKNPYVLYSRLRALGPIHWLPGIRAWFVFSYDDVQESLRNPDLGWGPPPYRGDPRPLTPLEKMQRDWLLLVDPPTHTQLRRSLHDAFPNTEVVRALVQETVDTLLYKAVPKGEIEFMHDIAYPLSFTVIFEIVGIPLKDRDKVVPWLRILAKGTEVHRGPELKRQGDEVAQALRDYIQGLIKQRRKSPQDDMISKLLQAQSEADSPLPVDIILNNIIMVLATGFDNTRSGLGNALLALLTHPKQLDNLRQSPEYISTAVEELLRYDPPVQMIYRRALKNTTVAGKAIAKGEGLALVVGSATRDRS
ncbi:MAG: cytochrome P450, partial [Chloroflexota bacterium]